MAFEDDFDPDWIHDLPFYIVAVMAHGWLLVLNPTMRWGSVQKALDMVVPIEFVAQAPTPSVNLAPAPARPGKTEQPPRHGAGEYRPAKIRSGAVAPPPKPLPSPKPAALPSKREKSGHALIKVKPPAKAKPRPAVDAQAIAFAKAAKAQALEARLNEEKARRAAEKAQHDAEVRAERARRAEAARLEAERRGAERAEKARKKAELSQELATMTDPDEALETGGASGGGGKGKLRSASKSGAAAALAETAESRDPGDAAGSGGGELLDAIPRGGGTGPEGGGVSWALDGPVGSRRVLKRTVPASPDWVGTRGLDLTLTVRFQVLPDGTVKAGAVILKTSGFPEIDRLGLDALRQWRFEPVLNKSGPEVWGRVSFRFTS